MSKREFILRLNLILRKLRSKPASFDEILDFLEREGELRSYNFIISKRTFQRDIQDIATIFNIEIEWDSHRQLYYIAEQYPGSERLLEAFDTFNALNTRENLSQALYFEERRPLGLENMHGLIHAIKNNLKVKFDYQKYWEEGVKSREIHPYALKEFNHRWYLVGLNLPDGLIKVFGLDRISNLSISHHKFKDPNFNVKDYFYYCFGIIRPDENDKKPEKVELKFTSFKGKYIKSLPLHHTQKVILENEQETVISLEVYLTHDFKMEVLSHGHEAKVLEPAHFGKEIEEELLQNLGQYK